jgi:DNA-binding LacI/PurR family transcriptional regulator
MPHRAKTMTDIAKECGVSQSTVSLVLSNNPRISEDTRSKVLAAIQRTGYRPNIHARGLATNASRVFSVVLPDLENVFAEEYFGTLLGGIYAGASAAGYKVVVDVANMKFIRTQEYMDLLNSRRADGMIFLGSSLYDKYLVSLEGGGLRVMLVDNYFLDAKLSYVASDHKAAGRLAAEHLLKLGHRRIGLITGTNVQTAQDFLEAAEQTLKAAGIPVEDTPWADGRFSEAKACEAAGSLLAARPDLTAIIAGNDKMALGVMRCAREKGIRVPDDLSVIGMDNVRSAGAASPGLTTVDPHLNNVGLFVARKMLAWMHGEFETCAETLPVDLVVRQSTARPRG